MPYFGNTKYAVVDDKGLHSVFVVHFTENRTIAVALFFEDFGYVFMHDGELYFAHGKINLCQQIEMLPEYKGFAVNEIDIYRALVDFRTRIEIKRMKENTTE